jgi:nicotinate phosphoribosyltransferase
MNIWEKYTPELVTDLYELTMASSYLREGMNGEATFSLFIRDYPKNRNYFIAAGVHHFVEMATEMRFNDESLAYLASLGSLPKDFLDYLRNFRFTGSIRAIPEGRIFFTQEPILEVTAPIIEAQILETLAINTIQLETMLACKAARCIEAAQGRGLIDFGLRRTHGVDAGLKAARASYLTGFLGTSNVLAGKIYDIPVFGTMAHSYVTSFPREIDAFEAYAKSFPDNTVLLIDTYDTLCGAGKAVETARRLKARGKSLRGVRLDSGDLVELSRRVKRLFVEAGFPDVKIMASGSLDEFSIRELLSAGAELDILAVGTKLGVSADAPYFDIAYKLVEYNGRPVLKLSSGKKTWVGRKQVYRFYDRQEEMQEDVLGLISDEHPEGEPLLHEFVSGGNMVRPLEPLDATRAGFAKEFKRLPQKYRAIDSKETYPVRISPILQKLDQEIAAQKRREEIEGIC